jgi:pyrroline-5-carboxylate reductase
MSNLSVRIAFLGAGRMASAIVDGLLARGAATAHQIACLGGAGASAAALARRTGITLAADLPALLAAADVVVLAFKPQHLASADPRLAELTRGKLVLSVLAAKTLARLAQASRAGAPMRRSRPPTGPW